MSKAKTTDIKKILFITGTRADYGKMKSLMKEVEADPGFGCYIYVSGMHLIELLGSTYKEVVKDGYRNVQIAFGLANTRNMSYDLGDVIRDLTGFVMKNRPDMIVVHGDRIDALAGAVVGALNNIIVAHIEGGELSGTIDDSIRHAISKFAHIHMVSNDEAAGRLLQLGEEQKNIHIIGSPDIDIMMSPNLPSLDEVKERYEIPFDKYAILMYHPVTTEYEDLNNNIKQVVDAVIASGRKYVVIYPNNDLGYELILNEYRRFRGNRLFRMFPSLRFEHFLTLLKNADFMVGNSSGGIREANIYGIPSIDIGTRQQGRYTTEVNKNIQHVIENKQDIMTAIERVDEHRYRSTTYGDGNSTMRFMELIRDPALWEIDLQKRFIDFNR